MSSRSETELREIATHGVHRAKKPEMPVHLRQPENTQVEPIEQVPAKYIALALVHLKNQMARIAKMAGDYSRPVDEYFPMTSPGDTELQISVPPTMEIPVIIHSIVIVGPAGTVTLQLGDRIWPLTIPATGILVIAPVMVTLSRSDSRILTGASAGLYSLELMGYVDERAG